MAYAAAHPEHVAKLVLSDSPGPSWKSIVHVLPEVFPDIEEENQQEAQKLGPDNGSRRPRRPAQPLPHDLLFAGEA